MRRRKREIVFSVCTNLSKCLYCVVVVILCFVSCKFVITKYIQTNTQSMGGSRQACFHSLPEDGQKWGEKQFCINYLLSEDKTTKNNSEDKNMITRLNILTYILPVFSLGQTDKHRYHDSPLSKTSSWMENCTKFGQLILSKIIKIVAKMHQIRFRLGLRPRPRWGRSQRSPRPSSWI